MFNVCLLEVFVTVDYNYPTPHSTISRKQFYRIMLVFFFIIIDPIKHPFHCMIKQSTFFSSTVP